MIKSCTVWSIPPGMWIIPLSSVFTLYILPTQWGQLWCHSTFVMWSPSRSVCVIVAEMRQISHRLPGPGEEKGQHGLSLKGRAPWSTSATLSRGECPWHLLWQTFIGFNLHRNAGHIRKAHQSLSGWNDQIIDNIQRTMRAYLESRSDS